jgi:hypothetical protein
VSFYQRQQDLKWLQWQWDDFAIALEHSLGGVKLISAEPIQMVFVATHR